MPRSLRGRESLRDLRRDLDRAARRQRSVRERLAQRLAVEQLLDHVGNAVGDPGVVDGDDVRVVEHAGGARFGLEALQSLGVRRERGRQHLDRDVAAEARIARAVDLAHGPGTEGAGDLVRAEPRS